MELQANTQTDNVHIECKNNNKLNISSGIYSKNASSVAIFLDVVHCSVDEYLRKILQHLHELHRKGPYFLCCDDKDAMTVTTQKKMKN